MNRIAVPINFGPATSAVTRYAALLAQALGSDIELIYAHQSIDDRGYTELTSAAVDAIRHRLQGVTEDMNRAVDAKLHISHSTPRMSAAQAIEQASLSSDLIIMGQTESRGIWRFMMGDTTSEVAAVAKCPILVVPAGSEPSLPTHFSLALDKPLGNDRLSVPFAHLAQRLDVVVDVYGLNGYDPRAIAQELKAQRSNLKIESEHTGEAEDMPQLLTISQEQLNDTWLCLASYPRSSFFRTLFGALNDRLAALSPIPTLLLVEVPEERLVEYEVAHVGEKFSQESES